MRQSMRTRPPYPTLATGVARRPGWIAALAGVVLAAVAVATYRNGHVLLIWDAPLQQLIESYRTDTRSAIFHVVTHLGTTGVVVPLGGTAAMLCWRHCRAVALTVAAVTVGRIVVEIALKLLVERPRPSFAPLASYGGFAFPSGHVLGAVAFWGLVPMIVATFTTSHRAWRTAAAGSAAVIVAVAASRVYLGVHWVSDVTAALAVGTLLLVVAEAVIRRHQRERPDLRVPSRRAAAPTPAVSIAALSGR